MRLIEEVDELNKIERMYLECLINEESSDDLISRASVLALINKAMFNTDNKDIQDYIFNGLRRDVHHLPSSDRPKGEWIVENHEVVCSVCGQNNLETNFCPCCGADMRGEK